MKKSASFVISPSGPGTEVSTLFGTKYRFDFPPVCTHCGKPAQKTSGVHLLSPLGAPTRSVWIKVPYCAEHLTRVRVFTQIKFGFYLLSYIVTMLLIMLIDGPTLQAAAFTIFIWGPFVFPLLRFLLIKPLMRIVDEQGDYDCNNNTLSLTARLDSSLSLVLNFANPAVAEQFATANGGNPCVKPLPVAVLSLAESG